MHVNIRNSYKFFSGFFFFLLILNYLIRAGKTHQFHADLIVLRFFVQFWKPLGITSIYEKENEHKDNEWPKSPRNRYENKYLEVIASHSVDKQLKRVHTQFSLFWLIVFELPEM